MQVIKLKYGAKGFSIPSSTYLEVFKPIKKTDAKLLEIQTTATVSGDAYA